MDSLAAFENVLAGGSMRLNVEYQTTAQAIVNDILPTTGLAYLVDDSNRTWTVTKQNAGIHFDDLYVGQQCILTLDHHHRYTLVKCCEPVSGDRIHSARSRQWPDLA